MKQNSLTLVALLGVLLLSSVGLFGQAETGLISGTVTDSSNAVVPGATVTVVSTATGLTRTATTLSAGEYTITNLPVNTYALTIEHAGFQKYTRQVQVAVGSRVDISAQLAVTGASTTVEVSASGETATVNTETQSLSNVVTAQQITDLPTLTRNPYDLVATSGNVTEDQQSGRGAGYAINGQRSADTDIMLDGGENVDLFTATVGQSVPLDSVQEFVVVTSNFTAEYGRAGGGVVNVATKSGTNQFHGSLYEFNRVSALAANTYNNDANGIAKPGFTRNQFGYSIGGPIVKNKLFFFSSTEWTRVRSQTQNTFSIIDPAFLALPQISANTTNFFSAYGKLRPGIQVLSSVNYGQAIGASTAAACAPLSCNAPFGQYIAYQDNGDSGAGAPQNTYSTVARVDYNFSDKTTLYGRYALYSEDDFAGYVNSSPYVGYDTGQTNYNQSVLINLTHVFSPSIVNSVKVAYNRLNNKQPLGANPVGPTLYTSSGLPTLPGVNGTLVFPGYSETTPGNAIPFGGPQNVYQIYDDLSWTKGRHQFKFGGGYIQTRDNRAFGAYENAVEYLSSSSVKNAALALVAGLEHQFQGAVYPQGQFPCSRNAAGTYVVTPSCLLTLPVGEPSFNRNNRYNDGNWYVQDSWKATPKLTINLGLRWEYYGVQHNSNPALDSNFYLGSGATLFDQVRNGTAQIADKSPVGGLWGQDKDNFAPRVGFAYDIFGNGTMSFRGGYGIGYERNFGNVTFNVIQNPPNYGVISVTSGTDVPAANLPIYTNNGGPLAGAGSTCGLGSSVVLPGTSCFPNPSLRAVQQNIPTAYIQFWSGALDYQVLKNSVLSFEYTGSKGTHEYDISNLNAGGYGAAFLGDAVGTNRLNYQYSNINYRGSEGFNEYNGLNVKFQTNNLFNKGLYLNVNYTWSHAIDNLSSAFSDGTTGFYGLGYLDPYNANLDKGNADYDIRNRFVVSGTWNIPYGSNSSNAVERQVLGGWSFSPILNIRSGLPYSIFDGTNVGATGYSAPFYIPSQPINQNGSASNSTAVAPNLFNYLQLPIDPTTGIPVNAGDALAIANCQYLDHGGTCLYSSSGLPQGHRNAYRGPGYWNFNFVAAKTFKLTERFNMQFRAEFYDAFNHSNYYINTPNLDVEDGTGVTAIQAVKGQPPLGYSIPPAERRNIQFGLKLNF